MPTVECYSLRRVNPFRGVVAVVKTRGGRAFSLDGVHWQIQVLAHPPRGLWANDQDEETLRYFPFGLWEAARGLTRVPLNPLLDVGRMVAAVAELTPLLPERGRALPFPLAPEHELWLLDREGEPLALLATALEQADPAVFSAEEWHSGGRGERPFVSPALIASGIPDQDGGGRFCHAEAIERLIRQSAGPSPRRRWYGPSAQPASGGDAGPVERPPVELPMRACWPDALSQGLVDDYLGWLSPYLLTLPTLSDPTRLRLERQACRHALLVEATWRLYPKVINPSLLRQARVEARLRQASAA